MFNGFIYSQPCDIGTAKDSIVNNDIKISVSTSTQIEFKKNKNILRIWPWICGTDPAQNLKMAVSTYPTENRTDFFPGPLDNGYTNSDKCSAYDKVFKVTKKEINTFREQYNSGQIESIEDIPESILYWPGKKNKYFEDKYGIEIQRSLADFFDFLPDDLYDPMVGDYPQIENADEALFWIVNDAGNYHTLSHSKATQTMIVNYALLYNSHPDPLISNTLFIVSKTYYQAASDLLNKYYSLYLDYDSPDMYHDKFGTIPEKDAVYMFNQCGFTNNCNSSFPKSDSSITMVKMLDSPEVEGLKIGLSSILGSPFHKSISNCDGYICDEFYNLMKGFWIDGYPLTYGELGYNPGSLDTVNFQFDNLQSDSTKWTICDENNFIGDMKVLINSGSITNLPGDINTYAYSVTMFDKMKNPCGDIDSLNIAADIIQEFYDNRKYYHPTSNINLSNDNYFCYPNPSKGKVFVEGKSLRNAKIKVYNSIGFEVNSNITFLAENKVEIGINDNNLGVYFINIQNRNGEQTILKIILNK